VSPLCHRDLAIALLGYDHGQIQRLDSKVPLPWSAVRDRGLATLGHVLEEILVWQLTILEFTNLPFSFMFVPWVFPPHHSSSSVCEYACQAINGQ
jgi:hypothetical protein